MKYEVYGIKVDGSKEFLNDFGTHAEALEFRRKNKIANLGKAYSTLGNKGAYCAYEISVPKFKVGQEVWVRATVNEIDEGKVDVVIADFWGTEDPIFNLDVKDIVAVKPEAISGNVIIEYNLEKGEVISVEPVSTKRESKETYKVVGYDDKGFELTYVAFISEEYADKLVNELEGKEVKSLNGFVITRLVKKPI